MPSARIRSALPPLAIPENKTPGMLDFVQPHTLTAKIGNRRVPVRHGTRLYVPGMLSDADQAYVDRQEMAQRGRLGIIPIAAAVGVAKVAGSFVHSASPRYEGGPLITTVLNFLGNQLRGASPAQARALVSSGAIGAGQKGWADVGAVLAPALRPDVFPQGPARSLTPDEMSLIAQVGGPVALAQAPASLPVPSTPPPGVIPPQPAPVAYSPTGPGAVAPAPAPFSFFPAPAPAPAPAYPGGPTVITVPGAPAPAPVTESMIPTGGGSNLLPLALGAGLLLVVALSGKGK